MGRGTLRDPFLDIEKSDTTISDVNKNSSRRNKIAFVLCLSLFLLGGAGFTFARQFTGEESETKSNDKDFVVTSKNGFVAFGSGFMSTSTGVILNNQMADFSIPTEESAAPANYIKANKRPLSSMMPLIITKNNELVGVIGASGGIYIIPAVIQVFLNHFVLNMTPLEAVKSPRVYHKLIPNQVLYEDWEVYNKDHILLKKETQDFLKTKNHELVPTNVGATVQFVVQNRVDDSTTVLTAVSDLRKDGKPAAADAAPTPAPAPSPMF